MHVVCGAQCLCVCVCVFVCVCLGASCVVHHHPQVQSFYVPPQCSFLGATSTLERRFPILTLLFSLIDVVQTGGCISRTQPLCSGDKEGFVFTFLTQGTPG